MWTRAPQPYDDSIIEKRPPERKKSDCSCCSTARAMGGVDVGTRLVFHTESSSAVHADALNRTTRHPNRTISTKGVQMAPPCSCIMIMYTTSNTYFSLFGVSSQHRPLPPFPPDPARPLRAREQSLTSFPCSEEGARVRWALRQIHAPSCAPAPATL